MLCGFLQLQTYILACPTLPPPPPEFGPSETPIVVQNLVFHHALRFLSARHVHREPCSELQTYILACPTLPPLS